MKMQKIETIIVINNFIPINEFEYAHSEVSV